MNCSKLLSQIQTAAIDAKRDPSGIRLVAVSKYATVEQMQEAYSQGIRHFGESRLQDALEKIPQLPKDIVWHFIGALQSNKIGKIVEHFQFIHSVDSLEIAQLIAKKSKELHKNPILFLQVNISQEPAKHGFSEEELKLCFQQILDLDLNIAGLMTMAPLTSDNEAIRTTFRRLRLLRDSLSAQKTLPDLSMGMSQDYLIAIAEGATVLRIGSLLFGN